MSQHYTVKECLHGYTDDALGMMCARWQLAARSKPNRIRALDKVLQDPLHVERMLHSSRPATVRLLHLIAERGIVSAHEVLHVPGLYTTRDADKVLLEAVETGLALVCPQERAGAFSLGHIRPERNSAESSPLLYVCDLMRKHLPPAKPLGVVVAPASEQPERSVESPPDRATAFFLETLRIVELLNPRVNASFALHKTDLARVQDQALEAELPVEAFSLSLMIARELGCVARKQSRLTTTARGGEWASQPYADRMRDLLHAYLSAQELSDAKLFFPQILNALDEHLPRGSLRRTYHRRMLVQVLREQPEGVWHSVDALTTALYNLDRNVLCLEERWRGIVANVREVTAAWKDRQWRMREQRFFAWMIRNLFRDLGLVELAEEGRLFRVTPTGRYALDLGPAPADQAGAAADALVVQPDFEVVVYADRCPPSLRRKLDTFCERVQRGMVSTYRLTQSSVYRGVRNGMPLSTFLGLIETHSKRPIPANVRHQLSSWERKLEAVRVYSSSELLECASDKEATSLLHDCNGARRIGERFILLAGYCPPTDAIVDYRESRRPCLHQDAGLTVRVPWEKSDLFVQRRLEELGDLSIDAQGDLVLRLTKRKLTHAEDWCLHLAQLEALSDLPLAGRYRVALQAWSGELETAASRTATLVRFEDPETCEAVLEFPDVAEHTEGRLGLYTLVIKQGQLGRFKKKLRERSILIKPADTIIDRTPPEEWAVKWVEAGRTPEPPPTPEAKQPRPAPVDEDLSIRLPSYSTRIVREILDDAIARRRPVLIQYQNAWSTQPSIRRIDPVALDMSGPTPSLSGFCHQSHSPRTFKLSQVSGIRVLEGEVF